jgi:RHS repeat-associated protein
MGSTMMIAIAFALILMATMWLNPHLADAQFCHARTTSMTTPLTPHARACAREPKTRPIGAHQQVRLPRLRRTAPQVQWWPREKRSGVRRWLRCIGISNPYLFTGRRLDSETGLQLNRNRFYHQQLGRWVSRDPIGYKGGSANLYEYVAGRPMIWVDNSGLVSSGLAWCGKCPKRRYKTKDYCCEDGKVVTKIAIKVCRGRLGGDDSSTPIWGPLSHTYIVCQDGKQWGFHPRPFDSSGNPLCGPGFVNEECDRDPSKAKCKTKFVCPKDYERMCPKIGIPNTECYYGMVGCFSSNCHEWGNCEIK